MTPLTTRIFREGTFAGNCARFRSVEFSSCGSCCDVPLEAILRSYLECVIAVSATDGAQSNINFLCGGSIFLTWRSRNVVPRMQSTARFVTTQNGTCSTNSPIRTYNLSSPKAFIHQFDASMSGGLCADLMAARHGSVTQHRCITFGPAPVKHRRDGAHQRASLSDRCRDLGILFLEETSRRLLRPALRLCAHQSSRRVPCLARLGTGRIVDPYTRPPWPLPST